MKLATIPFEKIRDGQKVIESRLYDEKRQMINLGDEILISEANAASQTVEQALVSLLKKPHYCGFLLLW